jgi:hypothetical protein
MKMSNRLMRVIGNYETKLRLGANGRLTEDEIRRRVDRYTFAAVDEDCVLQQVRQVLCSHGVVTMMFPYYHAFSRELGKLSRLDVSAYCRQEELMRLATKWVVRGLEQAVLFDIAANVFGLEPPNPPGDK